MKRNRFAKGVVIGALAGALALNGIALAGGCGKSGQKEPAGKFSTSASVAPETPQRQSPSPTATEHESP